MEHSGLTPYEDDDVIIEVVPADENIHIVVEKPTTNPDLRFRRHIMNFYFLEVDDEGSGFKIKKDFSTDQYIKLRVGRKVDDDPEIDESNLDLRFWPLWIEDEDGERVKKMQDLREYVGEGNYTPVNEEWKSFGAYVDVVIDKEWDDPNMGW